MASSKIPAAGGDSLPATTLAELVLPHWAVQCLCLTILPTSRIACNAPAGRTLLLNGAITIPDYATINRIAARPLRDDLEQPDPQDRLYGRQAGHDQAEAWCVTGQGLAELPLS